MSNKQKPKPETRVRSSGKMSHGSGVKIADSYRGMTHAHRTSPLAFRPILTMAQAKDLLAKAAKETAILAQARRITELEVA